MDIEGARDPATQEFEAALEKFLRATGKFEPETMLIDWVVVVRGNSMTLMEKNYSAYNLANNDDQPIHLTLGLLKFGLIVCDNRIRSGFSQ